MGQKIISNQNKLNNIDLILLDGNPIYDQFEYTKEDCLNNDFKETELLTEEEIR